MKIFKSNLAKGIVFSSAIIAGGFGYSRGIGYNIPGTIQDLAMTLLPFTAMVAELKNRRKQKDYTPYGGDLEDITGSLAV